MYTIFLTMDDVWSHIRCSIGGITYYNIVTIYACNNLYPRSSYHNLYSAVVVPIINDVYIIVCLGLGITIAICLIKFRPRHFLRTL